MTDNEIEMPEAVTYIASDDLWLLEHGVAPISPTPSYGCIGLYTADQLRAAVLKERERLKPRISAGAMLSNCAFNLAQRDAGSPLTQRDIDALHECRVAWDAARKEHP